MSPATLDLLTRAGFFPGRRVALERIDTAMRDAGQPPLHDAARAFLETYAGLGITWQREIPLADGAHRVVDGFHFDAAYAASDVDAGSVAEYARRVAREICIIGQASLRHSLLLMDPDGRVYAAADETIALVDETGEAAIERLARGEPPLHVLPGSDHRTDRGG